MSPRYEKRIGLFIVGLALIILVFLFMRHPFVTDKAPEALPLVTVQAAIRQDIPVAVDLLGTVNPLPDNDVKMAPAISGKIQSISVQVGQWVVAGQPVATLDTRLSRSQATQSNAALAAAQANYLKIRRGSRPQEILQAQSLFAQNQAAFIEAQQAVTRAQGLFAEKIMARKDLQAAQAQYKTAQAQLNSAGQQLKLVQLGPRLEDKRIAQAQMDQAQAALAQSQIQVTLNQLRAPIAGRIDQILLGVGNMADTTTPIIRLLNLKTVLVKGAVPANAQNLVHIGQSVQVDTTATHPLLGSIIYIGEAFDPTVGGFPVYIKVANPQEQLRLGSVVPCRIIAGRHPQAVLVPKSALIPDPATPNRFRAYTLTHNTVHQKNLVIGETLNQQVEVLSGMMPGEMVVTQGGYGLEDGSRVKVQAGKPLR